MKDEKENKVINRAQWESKHHKTFDYKDKKQRCIECGEKEGRHTYKCIYFDRD